MRGDVCSDGGLMSQEQNKEYGRSFYADSRCVYFSKSGVRRFPVCRVPSRQKYEHASIRIMETD
jgi:hypothetical protein